MTAEVHPVRQVVRYLRTLIEQHRQLSDLWIAGEVANLRLHSSGHIYFSLRDADTALRCVFFRSRNVGQRDRLANGASLIVHGSLSLYEQAGDLSFIVDFVQPDGTGALSAEFERRRAAFEAEGLFAPERKRGLPRYPRTVGVVTSRSGAALQDVLTVLARRWPAATVLVQPTPVQGATCAPEVAEAIRTLGRRQPDVIIVTRGGGSEEDLWGFNEEPVVRAIYGCPVPVVSAVGHETDTTLADLVADVRAPTPSAAAELVTPDRPALLHRVESLHARSEVLITRRLAGAREDIDLRAAALDAALPDLDRLHERVRERSDALHRHLRLALRTTRSGLAASEARLRALSPEATLARGYAIVEGEDGRPVTSTGALPAGTDVHLRLRDGRVPARISGGAEPPADGTSQ